ncbi:hypothetical protein GOP47_0024808 [Adiantum capillus-veneris]|uniref:THH1/TOM1/TOM3 domain-containing protein n=1 Tax=Adiantum capillus-veneris TaxID=13818 RepID=A0A9D4U2T2_ADICA|nr:hypothetical protein GOP47_0024808 [Adiantum capillus-veneris]
MAVQGLYSWWDEVDNSRAWQSGVFYSLCAAYSLVGGVAALQLMRIELRVPEYGWTTQKVFHLMNFIVNAARAVVFGFHYKVFTFKPKVFRVVFLDLPGLLFFSTYTLLVLFWAEIYHQARSLPTEGLRSIFLILNGIVYFIQVCIWLAEWITMSEATIIITRLFLAVLSITAALGFLTYGGRLFLVLRRFPIESKGRQKKLREVGFVTAICFTCFLIRAVVAAWAAFNDMGDVDSLYHPILNLFYYLIVEIIPASLVLFILRKLPPKRVAVHYHAIR